MDEAITTPDIVHSAQKQFIFLLTIRRFFDTMGAVNFPALSAEPEKKNKTEAAE